MKTLSLLLALSMVTAAQAVAATSTLTVPLQEQNGSGESGTATLTQVGNDVKVDVSLKGQPSRVLWNGETYASAAQPAQLGGGSCGETKGVVYSLGTVQYGKATTVLKGVTIDQLLKGSYAINVNSTGNSAKNVACGNVLAY
jgi:opacity protein-like surface antigen